jgi:hypothetical protein
MNKEEKEETVIQTSKWELIIKKMDILKKKPLWALLLSVVNPGPGQIINAVLVKLDKRYLV